MQIIQGITADALCYTLQGMQCLELGKNKNPRQIYEKAVSDAWRYISL